MTNLPTVPELASRTVPDVLEAEVHAAKGFALEQHSAATRRAYRSDLAVFTAWCDARQIAKMPAAPEAIATFLSFQAKAGVRPSTLARRVAAIRYAHALAGFEPPTSAEIVKATMRGIRRSMGVARTQKAP